MALPPTVPFLDWAWDDLIFLALAGITCSLVSSLPRMRAAAVAAVVAVATFALPMRLNIMVAIAVC